MGLADRFSDTVLVAQVKTPHVSVPVKEPVQKLDSLRDELFEKIVTVPCWFEYDAKTQHDLIIKFLTSKNIKTPEVFAKILQHSILGFGVFDEYLMKKDVSAIFYEEGEPLLYTENDRNVVDTVILPSAKVNLAIKNIINMSQYSDKSGVYDFRIADFWVQLRTIPHSRIKLSISKITDEFLADEINKTNLTLLLSDI